MCEGLSVDLCALDSALVSFRWARTPLSDHICHSWAALSRRSESGRAVALRGSSTPSAWSSTKRQARRDDQPPAADPAPGSATAQLAGLAQLSPLRMTKERSLRSHYLKYAKSHIFEAIFEGKDTLALIELNFSSLSRSFYEFNVNFRSKLRNIVSRFNFFILSKTSD